MMDKSHADLSTNNCGELWVMDPSTENATEILLILIAVNGVSLSLAMFLNLSAMIVLKQIEDIPGGNKVILFNLSLADFLSGFLSQLLWIALMAAQLMGYQVCSLAKAATFCGLMLWMVSFSVLVLASIERYICIFYPFFHERISNSRVFICITLLIWLKAILVSILYNFSLLRTAVNIGFAVINSIGCCTIAFIYASIYHVTCKVRKEIQDQAASVGNHQTNSRRDGRFINLVAVVVGLSLLFYIPFAILVCISIFTDIKINVKVIQILWTLVLANSFIDPICYFMLNKKLRRKLIALWKRTGERGNMA